MKNLFPFILSLMTVFMFSTCNQQGERNETDDDEISETDTTQNEQLRGVSADHLEEIWVLDTLMITPESVIYDKKRDRIYVSNINGDPSEEDGNGYISSVGPDGELISAYLFSGYLDAPKGMAIVEDKLYVSDITKIVEIDLNTEVSTNTWEIDTAKFLNDVAAGPDGKIYFSDSRTNTIYTINNDKPEVYISDAKLNGPNGIFIDGNTMMVTNMGGSELLKINMDDKNISTMSTGIGAGDGLEPVGDGRFLASSWSGQVFLIESDGTKETILDTQIEKINAADIGFIADKKVLLVPTFSDNRVVAYKLKDNQ